VSVLVSLLILSPRSISDEVPGAYLVVAIQSIMILSRRRKDKVKTIMLTYAVSMLCLVLAWFTLAAASNEAGLVEIPMHARLGGQCKPVDISRSVLITFIFWAGDGLLVMRSHLIVYLTLICCTS
jgi:hypothetical protein